MITDAIKQWVADYVTARLKTTRHENSDHLDKALPVIKLKPSTLAGDVLTTDSTGKAAWGTTGSALPTGAAGGDLSVTYPNPTVAKLNGQIPSYYLSRANHTGTQTSSTISDFSTTVQASALTGDVGGTIGATVIGVGKVTSSMVLDGTLLNADINAAAAIALSKLATDPLARANHTGTQLASTVSDFAATVSANAVAGAVTGTVGATTIGTGVITSTMILDGTILNADINASAAIALSKLATDPLARANHTGTQLASTISDFSAASDLRVQAAIGTATPIMDSVAAVGTGVKWAKEDHVHPTDTTRAPLASPTFTGVPAAPTAAVDTNTTQLATMASVLAQAASATPLIDATVAVVGTSTRFARGDHVHPTDTSRLAVSALSGSTLTGDVGGTIGATAIGTGKVTSTHILDGTITNLDISEAAAINPTKLDRGLDGQVLTTSNGAGNGVWDASLWDTGTWWGGVGWKTPAWVNADVAAGAAIAYSKLNLATSIVNADVATGAAIVVSKLATGTNLQVVATNGTTPAWTSLDSTYISNFTAAAQAAAQGGAVWDTDVWDSATKFWAGDYGQLYRSTLAAKGDMIVATAARTPSRFGVGADATVLQSDSTATTGVSWVADPVVGIRYMASMWLSGGSPSHTASGATQLVGIDGVVGTFTSEFDVRPAGVAAQVDTTNKKLLCQKSGVYRVTACVTFSAMTTGVIAVAPKVNGVIAALVYLSPAAALGAPTVQVTRNMILVVGDYLQLGAYQQESASEAYSISANYYNYIQMEYLGPST